MSIPSVHKDHDTAKNAGWFSRRHQTNAELQAVRAKRQEIKEKRAQREALANTPN